MIDLLLRIGCLKPTFLTVPHFGYSLYDLAVLVVSECLQQDAASYAGNECLHEEISPILILSDPPGRIGAYHFVAFPFVDISPT